MTIFRPCIDLHAGSVKQIVGGSLSDNAPESLKTNFTTTQPAGSFAKLYKEHGLTGAHVIMLGPGNDSAATEALQAWPDALQLGGGIDAENAQQWVEKGAKQVIVTSYLFPDGSFSEARLGKMVEAVGKERLVIDLSCRRRDNGWFVAMNKWQSVTDFEVNQENISMLEKHASEFLIHAADMEGLQRGIDEDLVARLAEWCNIPVTYAGGGKHLDDLALVHRLSRGKVDLTIGSALDLFGGTVQLMDCVQWNRTHGQAVQI